MHSPRNEHISRLEAGGLRKWGLLARSTERRSYGTDDAGNGRDGANRQTASDSLRAPEKKKKFCFVGMLQPVGGVVE